MLSEEMRAYRHALTEAGRDASAAYDKAIMTLSGGALGLSITFMKDIVHSPGAISLYLLRTSWSCLTASLTAILISMLSSQWALTKAIHQVDQESLAEKRPGGIFSVLTAWLNGLSALAFVLGVAFLAWFVVANLQPVRMQP
jgi:hypothetical protein